MKKRFLYRADKEYKKGSGIMRMIEDKDYKRDIVSYIQLGSGWDNDTHPYISLTENVGVAFWYSYSIGLQESILDTSRKPILVTDMELLREKTGLEGMDFSDKEVFLQLKKSKEKSKIDKKERKKEEWILDSRYNYLRASQEIIIKTNKESKGITEECLREIPPYLVDILQALDMVGKISGNQNLTEKYEEKICQMLMDGDNNKLLSNMLENIKLTKFKEDYIRLYYQEGKTIQEVLNYFDKEKNIKMDLDDFCCVRTQIVKDIFSSEQFQEIIKENVKENEKMELNNLTRIIDMYYYGFISEEFHNHHKDSENQNNWEHNNIALGESLCIKVPEIGRKIPYEFYTVEDLRKKGYKKLREYEKEGLKIEPKLILPENCDEIEEYGSPVAFNYANLTREERNSSDRAKIIKPTQKANIYNLPNIKIEENFEKEQELAKQEAKIKKEQIEKQEESEKQNNVYDKTKNDGFTDKQFELFLQKFFDKGQKIIYKQQLKTKTVEKDGVIADIIKEDNKVKILVAKKIPKNKEPDIVEEIEFFTPEKMGKKYKYYDEELKLDYEFVNENGKICKIKYGKNIEVKKIETKEDLKVLLKTLLNTKKEQEKGTQWGEELINAIDIDEQDSVNETINREIQQRKGIIK